VNDDDDYDGPMELPEPQCIGSCDMCGADVYDDEPIRHGSIRCDQCEWWAQQT